MSNVLQQSGTANFISDGAGGTVARIRLGPVKMGETWTVTRASISANGAANPTCRMYQNTESPSTFMDGTSDALQNVTDVGASLNTLDCIIFVFTGGTMSTQATVSLSGTQDFA